MIWVAVAATFLPVLAFAYVIWYTFSQAGRKKKLLALASELEMTYSPTCFLGLYDRFSWSGFFLPEEHDPGNVLRGRRQGRDVLAFDFRRSEGAFHQRVYSKSAAVISFPSEGWDFPTLIVKPKQVADLPSPDHVEFESHDFNGRFHVQCGRREFAYAVITPRMMEFLMANPGWTIAVCGPDALIYTGRLWSPGEFKEALNILSGFLDLIPRFVWKELGEANEAGRVSG